MEVIMRVITKPSTANCNLTSYVRYLLSEPLNTTCTGLSDTLEDISHDSVNRFLLREKYTHIDLWAEVSDKINRIGGTLSVDDTVADKPYFNINKSALISYFYSGKHHTTVKGVNIVTLYYTDTDNVSMPVNFRIVDPDSDQTKNDLFREMLAEVIEWGLRPAFVTGDSWYASIGNLKFIRKYGLGMLFGIESNRLVSEHKGSYWQIQALENWKNTGVEVYLKGYGMVKVFRQTCKESFRYYFISMPKVESLADVNDGDFEHLHSIHWNIENFHRAAKQLCSIEKFQVRNTTSIKNHIFCSFIGFVKLECLRVDGVIRNWYRLKKELFVNVVREFIASGYDTGNDAKLLPAVNA